MNTYVILRQGAWNSTQDLEQAASRSSRVGQEEMPDDVRWIRSYVVTDEHGKFGTVCVYQATSPGAVREHARRAGLPADEIIPVADMVVVNDDPVPTPVSPGANDS